MASRIRDRLNERETVERDGDTCIVRLPLLAPLRGGRRSVEAGRPLDAAPDPVLIAALRRAHNMVSRDTTGRPIVEVALTSPYDRRILRLAFLAPDIQRDILAGRQPRQLNLEALIHREIPVGWAGQRAALGWPA